MRKKRGERWTKGTFGCTALNKVVHSINDVVLDYTFPIVTISREYQLTERRRRGTNEEEQKTDEKIRGKKSNEMEV